MGSALFTCDDIKLAQRLIRPCLSQYMEREEVTEKLYAQEKIPAGLTELAWKKLEEQYPEFFKAYYLRVTLKQQITTFNRLLAEHAELTRQQQQQQHAVVSSSPPKVNGSHHDHAPASSPSPSSCCAALQGTTTMGNANTPHFAPNSSAPNGNNNSGIIMESYSKTANGNSGEGGGGQLYDPMMENMSLDEIWELFN